MADLKTFAPIRSVFESNLPVHIRIWIYSSIQENSINVVNTAAQKPITCMNLRANPSLHTLFCSVFASFTFISINVTIGAETEENVLLSHRIKSIRILLSRCIQIFMYSKMSTLESRFKRLRICMQDSPDTHTHTHTFICTPFFTLHTCFIFRHLAVFVLSNDFFFMYQIPLRNEEMPRV